MNSQQGLSAEIIFYVETSFFIVSLVKLIYLVFIFKKSDLKMPQQRDMLHFMDWYITKGYQSF